MQVQRRWLNISAVLSLLMFCTAAQSVPLVAYQTLGHSAQRYNPDPISILSTIREMSSNTLLHGVDVSEWDLTIDWDTLKPNVDFVILRSSYGHTGLDIQFARNQSEARRVDMPIGYYHYSYPQYNDPESEADHFVDTVGPLKGGELMCLDFEEDTSKDIVDWSARFMERVYSRTTVKPLLYINRDIQSSADWSRVIADDCGLWLAAWDGSATFGTVSSQWPCIAMKQYSATGTATGIPVDEVDLDVFNGGLSQFKAYGFQSLAPVLAITSPTSARYYQVHDNSLNISGTISDNVPISEVTWANNRGGNGSCTLGDTTWSASGISLQPGRNTIAIAATNANGEQTTRRLNVFYSAAPQDIVLAGISNGSVMSTSNLAQFVKIPGVLSSLSVGDVNSDGVYDIAGLAGDNTVWYTTNKSQWGRISGLLKSITLGDFNGDGKDDIAGVAANGTVWYTTNRSAWTQVPGTLASIKTGDFGGAGMDGLAGLATNQTIWYTTNLRTWKQIPGHLTKLAVGDLNGDGTDDIIGIASDSTVWYTTDFQTWKNIPGHLADVAAGDFTPGRSDQIVGIASDDTIWETSNLSTWTKVPGRVHQFSVFGSSNTTGLAGISSNGTVWYTTNLNTWTQIPGTLGLIAAPRR